MWIGSESFLVNGACAESGASMSTRTSVASCGSAFPRMSELRQLRNNAIIADIITLRTAAVAASSSSADKA